MRGKPLFNQSKLNIPKAKQLVKQFLAEIRNKNLKVEMFILHYNKEQKVIYLNLLFEAH
jgi:hypothetical protein